MPADLPYFFAAKNTITAWHREFQNVFRVLYFQQMPSKFRGRIPYLVMASAVVLLDLWTKSLIHNRLALHESFPVIDGLFDITYVRNTGVAFGIFSSIDSSLKAAILSLFTLTAAVLVVIYSVRSPQGNRLLQSSLALILGGALGNLYDRATNGYVIDFMDVYAGSYHWPAFNVADAAISFGVLLLALEIYRNEIAGRA